MLSFLPIALLAALTAPQEPLREAVAEPVAATESSTALELEGTFVPAEGAAEIALWPETWTRGATLREVVPAGTMVEEGQVLAVPDLRALDERIAEAERELERARLDLELAEQRAELDERRARLRLHEAERDLMYARQALDDFRKFELPYRNTGHDLAEMYAQHGIEDQEAELEQLEAMYSEDELTDATEEIVLHRSRRNLRRSRLSLDHARDRRGHEQEVEWEMEQERLLDAQRRADERLEQLHTDVEIERAEREARLARQRQAVERQMEELGKLHHDRELLVVRAPRAGVLLHGAPGDYGPGATPPRHAAGDALPLHRTAFTVMQPGALAVAFTCGESQLAELRDGGTARLTPLFDPERSLTGAYAVDPLPLPESARGDEGRFAGRVVLPETVPGAVPGMRVTVTVPAE